MLVKDNKKRVNIMLDEAQREYLALLAEERKSSVSEIIRELIEDVKKKNQALKLAKAVEVLAKKYCENEELTAFTALDGEEII